MNNTKLHPFAMFRRPLLPKNVLAGFEKAICENPDHFEPLLKKLFSDPVLLEAAQTASPTLHTQILVLLSGKTGSGKQKLLLSLYKYLIRLCTRSTPFGLFAGYFIADVAGQTTISFSQDRQYEKYNRLDASVLWQIKGNILARPEIHNQLKFFANSTLYAAGDNYRYIKTDYAREKLLFTLSQFPAVPKLADLLQVCKKGLTSKQIKNFLQRKGISAPLAEQYLGSLLASQVLVSELEINLTGPDYFDRIVGIVEKLEGTGLLTTNLTQIQKALKEQIPISDVSHLLHEVFSVIPIKPSLHTDIKFNTIKSHISTNILEHLKKSFSKISLLQRRIKSTDLQDFARKFHQRYGQQTLPLAQVIDDGYGIGYGHLNKQHLHQLGLLKGFEPSEDNAVQQPLKRASPGAKALYLQAITMGAQRVKLTQNHIIKETNFQIRTEYVVSPGHFYVLGSIHAQSAQALDNENFDFELKAFAGPSASNLLNRFAAGNPDLQSQLQMLIKKEEECFPDVIFAEISHLSDLTAGNILQRPALRAYELVYLAHPGIDSQNSIPVSDLMVSCPDGKKIVLTSRKHRKQIIPSFSSAHNFKGGLPLYRFLCDLASEHASYLQWDWGEYAGEPFLPRVNFENIVLCKASWKVCLQDFETQDRKTEKSGSRSQQEFFLQCWKQKAIQRKIPQYFTIGEYDQTLLIDSHSPAGLRLLFEALLRVDHIRITESLDDARQGLLRDADLRYSNEIIIPFLKEPLLGTLHSNLQKRSLPAAPITRSFTLGSCWMYVKLYVSESLADSVLTRSITPLCEQLENRQIIEKWFFVRYYDPEPHIRLRFYSNKKDFWVKVVKLLNGVLAPLLENKTISSVKTDIYDRELERYPQGCYQKIESLFHADSSACARALSNLNSQLTIDQRWHLALIGSDRLLSDLGLNLAKKIKLVESLQNQFSIENGPSRKNQWVADANYRAHKSIIKRILENSFLVNFPGLMGPFEERSHKIEVILSTCTQSENKLIAAAAPDLLHLFLNRWFYCEHRSQEFVIYHYLKKYYYTQLKNNNLTKN